MILVDYQRAFCGCLEKLLVLDHHSLVRTFILHATAQEIVATRHHLIHYMFSHVGYNTARACGIIYAIFDMCSYETMKLTLFKSGPEYVRNHLTFCSFDGIEVQLEPPQEASYRDTVIDLFDKLFPFARG
ncbi:hypothetical protein L2E82_21134 [Cichorium intybus]|uniref:Uncharacterized protein n=1 Tax=Cichorium intybus TaxID=13427 RepID=A0ACB9DVA9_CICIN|nr:hypothetical protein L2E82_21134 [Cichorium intybus]